MSKESVGIASMIKRGLVSALGVLTGSYLLDGIHYDDSTTLVWVVLLLGVFTAVLKPLLVLFALPFVVLTLGIGVLFINALLYLLVGNLLDGFYVESFGTAFMGALIITIFNMLFAGWIGGGTTRVSMGGPRRRPVPGAGPRRPRKVKAKEDVIDI